MQQCRQELGFLSIFMCLEQKELEFGAMAIYIKQEINYL